MDRAAPPHLRAHRSRKWLLPGSPEACRQALRDCRNFILRRLAELLGCRAVAPFLARHFPAERFQRRLVQLALGQNGGPIEGIEGRLAQHDSTDSSFPRSKRERWPVLLEKV